MDYRCPGQDRRDLSIEILPCGACGYAVEVFSDEVSVYCPSCGFTVTKDRLPSCVDWCRFARECIGEKRWQGLKGG